MSNEQPGPYGGGQQDPYGQPTGGQVPPPTAPYGQTSPGAPYGQQPGSTPHGQPSASAPYGQQPGGGQPYGQQPYGAPARRPGERPTSVTAASWIAIVMSGLSAVGYGFFAVIMLAAGGAVRDELNKDPDLQDLGIDAGDIIGIGVAVMLALTLWSIIGVVLAVFTLRRSNAARILLVISAAVVVLLSLLAIGSLISVIPLLAALATIVLLFVGGANEWFSGDDPGSPTSYPQGPSGITHQTYGQQSSGSNPYGQDSYGQDSKSTYPPRDYPGR